MSVVYSSLRCGTVTSAFLGGSLPNNCGVFGVFYQWSTAAGVGVVLGVKPTGKRGEKNSLLI